MYQGCCLNDVTTLHSSGPDLLLRFVSDSTVNGRGFYLKFYTNETATGMCWQFTWKCLLEIAYNMSSTDTVHVECNIHEVKWNYTGGNSLIFFSIIYVVSKVGIFSVISIISSFVDCSPDISELTSESTIIIIIVITIVCLSCVGVILPLLYYKHKYPNSKFSNKILPRLNLPKTLKTSEKIEQQDNLRKNASCASTSGTNLPDLLGSCSYGQTNPDTNRNGSLSKASDKRLR